jgi:hypothetical protein
MNDTYKTANIGYRSLSLRVIFTTGHFHYGSFSLRVTFTTGQFHYFPYGSLQHLTFSGSSREGQMAVNQGEARGGGDAGALPQNLEFAPEIGLGLKNSTKLVCFRHIYYVIYDNFRTTHHAHVMLSFSQYFLLIHSLKIAHFTNSLLKHVHCASVVAHAWPIGSWPLPLAWP